MIERDWIRMARRHNESVEARMPLLASAGLVKAVTPDDIQEVYERWESKREIFRGRQLVFAERCRRRVARRVSPEELAELDARRSKLPGSSEYAADFWRGVLARLCRRPS
jgi:hypothetical protein